MILPMMMSASLCTNARRVRSTRWNTILFAALALLLVSSTASPTKAEANYREALLQSRMTQIFTHHPHARWVHAEDNALSDTLSLTSLTLASSLIAEGRVVGTLRTLKHGVLRTDYNVFRIDHVFRAGIAADSALTSGSSIIVADEALSNGDEFLDDLELNQTERAVVFLQRLPRAQYYNGHAFTLYHFTAPYVSKYAIHSSGDLTTMSVRATRMRDILGVCTMQSFVLNISSAGSFRNAGAFLTGLRSQAPQVAAQYMTLLATNPWKVESAFAQRDSAEAGTIPHQR